MNVLTLRFSRRGFFPRATCVALVPLLSLGVLFLNGCATDVVLSEPVLRREAPASRPFAGGTVAVPEVGGDVSPSGSGGSLSERRSSVLRGAMVVWDADAGTDGEDVTAHFELVSRLGPDFAVVLGSAGVTPEGVVDRSGRVGLPVSTVGKGGVHVFPGDFPETGVQLQKVVLSPSAFLVFIPVTGLQRDPSGVMSWLAGQFRGCERKASVLLVLDQPAWNGPSARTWNDIEELLFGLRCQVHVLTGGVDRFSWWCHENVSYLCVGPLRGASDGLAALADGRVSGIVWVTLTKGGPMEFRVMEPSRVIAPQVFDRKLQLERLALGRAVTLSAVEPGDPVTTVRCVNPTGRSLEFQARWRFAANGADVSVDPQILGFRLAPRQEFAQEFRFARSGDVPLKFLRPRFELETQAYDGLGRAIPLSIGAEPIVVMRGEVWPLGSLPTVDGELAEWPVSGYPLNHPTQVVSGGAAWAGPEDLSGVLRVGVHGDRLAVALEVTFEGEEGRGSGIVRSGTVYISPDSPGAGVGLCSRPTLSITGDSRGRVKVEGAGGVPIDAAVSPVSGDGFAVEAVLPLSFCDSALQSGRILIDASVSESVSPGTPKVLFYSGTPGEVGTGRYFAVFDLPGEDE